MSDPSKVFLLFNVVKSFNIKRCFAVFWTKLRTWLGSHSDFLWLATNVTSSGALLGFLEFAVRPSTRWTLHFPRCTPSPYRPLKLPCAFAYYLFSVFLGFDSSSAVCCPQTCWAATWSWILVPVDGWREGNHSGNNMQSNRFRSDKELTRITNRLESKDWASNFWRLLRCESWFLPSCRLGFVSFTFFM